MYYARDEPLKEIEFSNFYWQRKSYVKRIC